jgi:hypothetical protein
LLAICFAPSLADSFIILTLTRLVVEFIFVNFSFALFTPPLGDFQLHVLNNTLHHVWGMCKVVAVLIPLDVADYFRRQIDKGQDKRKARITEQVWRVALAGSSRRRKQIDNQTSHKRKPRITAIIV